MSSAHEQRLADIATRIASIDEEVASIDRDFLELASAFNGVDNQQNLREAAALEARLDALRREKNLCIRSRAQAQDAIKHDQIVREQEEQQRRTTSAREIASALTTVAHELDDAMLALRQIFERRHALLRELQTTGIADGVATRFMQKGQATRAAVHWGLTAHLDIHRCAPGSAMPFSSADPVLRSIGKSNGSGSVEGET
jgi:hypothetical protein